MSNMVGKIFITRTGYDPEVGKHVKDPYLGPCPTIGACRPDLRKILAVGDHLFVISGKVKGADQFVMGGFEIAEKILAIEAYERFPDLRLRELEDGQLTGNIIVDASGRQHTLDGHDKFEKRVENYVVGKNLVALSTPAEIAEGREHTLEILRMIFRINGKSLREVLGRCRSMTEKQVMGLRECLEDLKCAAQKTEFAAGRPPVKHVPVPLIKV
jgi:hypothetical protein